MEAIVVAVVIPVVANRVALIREGIRVVMGIREATGIQIARVQIARLNVMPRRPIRRIHRVIQVRMNALILSLRGVVPTCGMSGHAIKSIRTAGGHAQGRMGTVNAISGTANRRMDVIGGRRMSRAANARRDRTTGGNGVAGRN